MAETMATSHVEIIEGRERSQRENKPSAVTGFFNSLLEQYTVFSMQQRKPPNHFTTLARMLALRPEWFSDSFPHYIRDEKTVSEAMVGPTVVEMPEAGAMTSSKTEAAVPRIRSFTRFWVVA